MFHLLSVINLRFYEGMFYGCMEILLEICTLDGNI